MSRPTPIQELNAIVNAVSGCQSGLSVEEIKRTLTIPLARRTLQRRLALLVNQNRLTMEGRSRSSRYRIPNFTAKPNIKLPTAELQGHIEAYVPLSSEGQAVRQTLRGLIQDRRPVGYNRTFLDAYRPNKTFYLPQETRTHLDELGRAPTEDRPAGTYAKKIYNRLLIDLSWNSSRLEGNTYSLLETERLLQRGKSAEGKGIFETQMILNHKAAIDLLIDQAGDVGFNRYTVLNLHALLSDNLLADPQACGRLRHIPVSIQGSAYHPLEVPQLIEECFQQILDTADTILDPFEQSFFVMVHLPYLQPFEDVNKRVSRLCANLPFIRNNLSPLSFADVPDTAYIEAILGVYELNNFALLRDVFIWAYERSSARYSAVRRSLGEPDPYRLHYRGLIIEAVAEVVGKAMDRDSVMAFLRQHASLNIPKKDRERFIEIVETEIMGLHEGNFARYRLRPAQYQAWRTKWNT